MTIFFYLNGELWTKSDAVRHIDVSDSPAEWMSAELSGSMAKFPRARAARFWTVSIATFLFRIPTEADRTFLRLDAMRCFFFIILQKNTKVLISY